jgi:tetratricopeptide (TPR) repeat protein
MNRKMLATVLSILALASAAFAQDARPADTEHPAAILPGLGRLHHPIATSSGEAQKFFNQGLTLIYAFNHEEAARSFRRAAELDPRAAMPHWGVALALGPNYNLDVDMEREKAAYDEVQKALALSAGGPEIERAYIQALAARFSNDPKPDFKKLAVDYSNAMKDLSRRFPDDLDAATLYAESLMDLHPWDLWNANGAPAEGTEEIVAVLESVLRRDPNHIGANHFYIHAEEASPHPDRALPSAARLGSLTPGAGHLVHMPAHIYARTGDFLLAVKSNEAAAATDRDYIQQTGAQGVYPMMYYSHNLHFLAYAAAQSGRYAEAHHAADQLVANLGPHVKEMAILENFMLYPTFVSLRFHKWREILSIPAPDPSLHMLTTIWHFARSMAYAATGDLKQAQAEEKAFAAAKQSVPAGYPAGFTTPDKFLALAAASLEAQMAEARGDHKAAIEAWRKAIEIQDGFHYDEPPDWYYPVRESLGGALLRDKQYAEAEKVFRADLARNPRNPRSLFGLWKSLAEQHRAADAEWVRREFDAAWKDADVSLDVSDL